ncbi:MAG: amidohydrolase family protein [Eggerthellaceae bacterium]|nr:amidohydrolase family protein [Eggerthellaceae bacterium]
MSFDTIGSIVVQMKGFELFGECHAHISMDGINYVKCMARHINGPDEAHVRACLDAYRKQGIPFVRDGGDKYGVSKLAKSIAPEYGIEYRTPIFAIYRKGGYGSIVGRAFENMREYAALVDEAASQGADFIKIMTTGIMDFNEFGRITHFDLDAAEVREMVHIAHEQGFAVMSHTNGKTAFLTALEAGVDSIEHGNYIDQECIIALSESATCFVPTATVAKNLMGRGLFDEDVLARIWSASRTVIASAIEADCLVAIGSDAGAVGVMHAQGALDEYDCFCEAVADEKLRDTCLKRGESFIIERFCRDS